MRGWWDTPEACTRYADSKLDGANMGPAWGRQDTSGPHVGPMNLVIRVVFFFFFAKPAITITGRVIISLLYRRQQFSWISKWKMKYVIQYRSNNFVVFIPLSLLLTLIKGGLDKMNATSKRIFWNVFVKWKLFSFTLKFHWNVFPSFQLTNESGYGFRCNIHPSYNILRVRSLLQWPRSPKYFDAYVLQRYTQITQFTFHSEKLKTQYLQSFYVISKPGSHGVYRNLN